MAFGIPETKYLRRAVVIREAPRYDAAFNHVHPNGKAKAIKPPSVTFIDYAGDNRGWCRISYKYNGKTWNGYIHDGNFLEAGYFRKVEADANLGYSKYWDASMLDILDNKYNPKPSLSSSNTTITYDSTDAGGAIEAVTAIATSSDASASTHLTKFTDPANSLGSSYSVFSPDPDPSAENELVSSKSQYEEPFNIFVLPGYTPARMTIYTYIDKKQVARSFEFLVGPSNMTESNTNSVIPLKTGAGFFLLRNGAELSRLNISGYLLESDAVDERRLFMENYYRSYMIDKVNTFHSYFNESSLYLELEGYRYQCILQNLDLAKAVDSLFLFRYSMNLLVLSQEPIGVIKKPGAVTSRPKQSPVRTEMVRGAGVVLGAAAALASMMTVRR